MRAYNKYQLEVMQKFNITQADVDFFTLLCEVCDEADANKYPKDMMYIHFTEFTGLGEFLYKQRLYNLRKCGLLKPNRKYIEFTNDGKLYRLLIDYDTTTKYIRIGVGYLKRYPNQQNEVVVIQRKSVYNRDKKRETRVFIDLSLAKKIQSKRTFLNKYL